MGGWFVVLATVLSGAVYGVDAYPVVIEVNEGSGDPQVVIVGLPDAAVKESKDRVLTALVNSGFTPPVGRTTINLAPAHIRKEGPSFDLPMAVGMLATQGDVDRDAAAGYGMIGELALSGEVRRVKGVLPIAMEMRERGCEGFIVPWENAAEAAVVEGLNVYPVRHLRHAAEFLTAGRGIEPHRADAAAIYAAVCAGGDDFADVKGQEHAKRALEVAVTGGHNVLMIGPPGTGKTMLAKRIPGVLPPMTLEEALETTKIHSIAGILPPNQALVRHRPFRAPHHTISDAGLLGGGAHPVPGEVSLTHRGVLFLDELPEFHRNVLEVLRQPLEDGWVTISRAAATVTFPCRFMLVAAMNPCPCGYFGDRNAQCRCTPVQIQNYRNRISGPLLDRIDIHIEVPAIRYRELTGAAGGEPSSRIRERVTAGMKVQRERFGSGDGERGSGGLGRGAARAGNNAEMRARDIQKHCRLDAAAADMLKMAITELNFSARAYDRILKVSRTIADLDGSETIRVHHVSEAIQYRTLDRNLWV